MSISLKWPLLIGALFVAISVSAQTPTITPLNPIVALGGTVTFSCSANCGSGPTWTCTNTSNGGACIGSFNAGTQVYTAPATGVAHQSLGGYQLLPNDHIFNTDISGLAAASNSATIMASVSSAAVNFEPERGYNYCNGSTPLVAMNFDTTTAQNANFQVPAFPTLNIESGFFDAFSGNGNTDHHFACMDTTNGNIDEAYQYFAQAPVTSCTINGSNSGTCTFTPTTTSAGFLRASQLGQTITMGTWTGGDTYLNNTFTLTAATLTTFTFNITHGSATTSTSGQASLDPGCPSPGKCNSVAGAKYTYADYVLFSNQAATGAAGTPFLPLTLRSQEFASAVANSTAIKHAFRFTLAPGSICGTSVAGSCCIGSACNATGTRHIWPATQESFSGGGIAPFGARFRLKASFNISTFSAAAQIILTAFKNYGLFLDDVGNNWQVPIDADNMPGTEANALIEINNAQIPKTNWEVVDDSDLEESSTSGAVNSGEVITYSSSTGTVTTHVDLQNSAVNITPGDNQYYIMAGTPQQQLNFYSNGAFTCAMSPTVGSITSDCKYTPPASEASVTVTTVTATSSVTNTVKAQIIVYVTPKPARFIQATVDFTDSHGAVWYSGGAYGIGMSSVPSWQGCCQNDNNFTNITDKQLWWDHLSSSQTAQDEKFDFHVPAGTYQITFNNGTIWAVGTGVRNFYVQGNLVATVDTTAAAGGVHLPYTLIQNVSVGSNNLLSFYNFGIGQQTANSGDISSISIQAIASQPGVTSPPRPGVLLGRKHHRSGRDRQDAFFAIQRPIGSLP